jgi:hypothetical protein
MFTPLKHACALSAAMLFCTTLAAQTATPPTTRPDPLNANAAVPALTYQSSFANYRRISDDSKPLSWREANEAAARIGGWRVYAREAQTADPAPAAPAAAASTAAPAAIAPPAPAGSSNTPSKPPSSSPSNAHQHHKP